MKMNNTSKSDSVKKKNMVRNIIFLQIIIMIYTLSTVVSKMAAGEKFLSIQFIGFYALEIMILGIYAVLWQQIIKHFQISIAYANRALGLLWSMIWAVVFFHDQITIKNIIGVIIVIIGTIIVNSDDK